MARRRYVSTEISTDPRVCALAEDYGAFAALLYTWMIPHSDDAGALSDDPRKLRMLLVPGFPVTTADVAKAVEGMVEIGLIEHDEETHTLRFPAAAFNRYQSYINKSRRESAQNAADHRETAENTTSLKSSSPVKSSSSVRSNASGVDAAVAAAPPANPDKPIPIKPERSVPKPNKYADVLDAIRELEPEHQVGGDSRLDGAAIKASAAPPGKIAAAYVAVLRGDWGDDWLRDNLSLQFVVKRIAGYETHLRAPPKSRNGQTAVGSQDLDAQRRRYATTINGGPTG